jgi:non-homologous end joining protein Ku
VSEYRASLKEMLEAKLDGREFEAPEEVVETPVVDLMEALRASVAAAGDKKTKAASSKKTAAAAPRKRAAAGRK